MNWLVSGLAVGLVNGLALGLVNGLVSGLVAGLAFGLGQGLMAKFGSAAFEPSRVHIQILGGTATMRKRFVPRFMIGLVTGLAFGLVDGLVFGLVNGGLTNWLMTGLVNALVFGLVLGPVAGLVFGLMAWFEAPLDIRSAASPPDLLKTNRTTVIFQLLVWAPVFGLMLALGGWLAVGLLQGLIGPLGFRFGFVSGLVWGLVGGFGGGLGLVLSVTAWGQWVALARIWSPLAGRLPWAVLAFLEDAYQRGVLRQAGAVYQFRHARLQDRLTHVFQARHDPQPGSSASSYTAINQ